MIDKYGSDLHGITTFQLELEKIMDEKKRARDSDSIEDSGDSKKALGTLDLVLFEDAKNLLYLLLSMQEKRPEGAKKLITTVKKRQPAVWELLRKILRGSQMDTINEIRARREERREAGALYDSILKDIDRADAQARSKIRKRFSSIIGEAVRNENDQNSDNNK